MVPFSSDSWPAARFLSNALRERIRDEVVWRSFDSDGVRLAFTDEGDGAPVVLLHGFAVTANLNWRWPGITEVLTREHRVVSVDMRGHGRSDKPRGAERYGMEMVRDVVRLLDHLGLERAFVAGYSLGGFVTLKLACRAPERLLGVAVLGAGWESPDNPGFVEALPRLADELEAGRGIGPLMQGLGEERARPSLMHRLWVKAMTRYLNDPHALVGVIRGTPALVSSEEELSQIAAPMLGVVGDRDPMLAPARAMVGRVRGLRLVEVPKADHIEAPMRAELVGALRDFLGEVR